MKTVVTFQHKSKRWAKKHLSFATRKAAREFMKRAKKRRLEVTILGGSK